LLINNETVERRADLQKSLSGAALLAPSGDAPASCRRQCSIHQTNPEDFNSGRATLSACGVGSFGRPAPDDGGGAVAIDPFEERLARVRNRFASTLEGKIEDMYNDLAQMSGEGGAVVEAIEASYRRVHGICGIGPTVGFTRTGRMAREVEAVLLEAYRTHRGLTTTEVASFQKKLHVLRETAKSELQLTFSSLR
jgi:hypothetical protein